MHKTLSKKSKQSEKQNKTARLKKKETKRKTINVRICVYSEQWIIKHSRCYSSFEKADVGGKGKILICVCLFFVKVNFDIHFLVVEGMLNQRKVCHHLQQ